MNLLFRTRLILTAPLVLLVLLMIPRPGHAWDALVHPELNRLGSELVQKSDPTLAYMEIYQAAYMIRFSEGGLDEDTNIHANGNTEDNCDATTGKNTPAPRNHAGFAQEHSYPRSRKHFYHPGTGLGLSNRITSRKTNDGGRCASAVTWARNDQNEGLTWLGAITRYGYTPYSKELGYFRAGHVGHLVGDMAQPDHVHLEPHNVEGAIEKKDPENAPVAPLTGTSLDIYAWDNWNIVKPDINGLTPKRYHWMESHLIELAKVTYEATSFYGGPLLKTYDEDGDPVLGVGIDLTSTFGRMFNVIWHPDLEDDWKLYNHGSQGAGYVGDNDNEYGSGLFPNDDEWYETYMETNTGSRGYYFVERNERAMPAFLNKVKRDGDEYTITLVSNTGRQALEEHLSRNMLPLAVEHIAGLLMHYYDVVNHPPILVGMTAQQAAKCVYDKRWNPVFQAPPLARIRGIEPTYWPVSERALVDSCPTEESRRWINGVDGSTRITLNFGADYDDVQFTTVASDTPLVPDRWEDIGADDLPKPMSLVDVHIKGVELSGGLSANGEAWTTDFTPPSDGSLDGIHAVEVTGKDRGAHYWNRDLKGDILDSSPGSLAELAQTSDPYNWKKYEPGADTNHALMIDVTPPTMTLVSAGVDHQNRTVAVYEVSDATSGIDFILVPLAMNATVVVDSVTAGQKTALVTITVVDRTHSAHVSLATADVAGNPYDPSVVIPVMAIKRGPDLPPINPRSMGLTPVAVLADEDFDPAELDLSTLVFGPGEASPKLPGHKANPNPHGNPDLMLHFPTKIAAIGHRDTDACLAGMTLDDAFVVTCQALRTVPDHAMDSEDAPTITLDAAASSQGGVALQIRIDPASKSESGLDPNGMDDNDAGKLSVADMVDIHRGVDPDPAQSNHLATSLAPAQGTALNFHDTTAKTGVPYHYWVVFLDHDGSAFMSAPTRAQATRGVDEIADARPMNRLLVPLPNPASDRVTLRYGTTDNAVVSLKIYDVRGRLVARVLDNETVGGGWHDATWSARDDSGHSVVSGVYYARLILNGNEAGAAHRFVVAR